ncbi:hypothetical protein BGZ99_005018 [Dissophora globulifera]|uniref:CCHC-type domain-containing protein n=1 Tax=Dissophora globulifera TaxID=979702 RepID=A0A9P6RIQ3_9FUNG|nr:hypothetical protein BGZ99_005018 [Dissophora globulifera]
MVSTSQSSVSDYLSVVTDTYSAVEIERQSFQRMLNDAKDLYRKAMNMYLESEDPRYEAYVEFELREVQQIEALGYEQGFLKPTVEEHTIVSVRQHMSISTVPEPKVIVTLSDVRWKDIPRWDKSWKSKNDFCVFLDRMSDFYIRLTNDSSYELAQGVANQCWLTSIRSLGGQSVVLAAQIRRAKSWVEMENEFKAWFYKLGSNPPIEFDSLTWEEDVSLPQFCQVFATSAQMNGLVSEKKALRAYLAYRFLAHFPESWSFGSLLEKYDQAPPLDLLTAKAIELGRGSPDVKGNGHLRRIPDKVAKVYGKPVVNIDSAKTRLSTSSSAGLQQGVKRRLEDDGAPTAKAPRVDGDRRVVKCYGCGKTGHIYRECSDERSYQVKDRDYRRRSSKKRGDKAAPDDRSGKIVEANRSVSKGRAANY